MQACRCALFSPENLRAGAVKELILRDITGNQKHLYDVAVMMKIRNNDVEDDEKLVLIFGDDWFCCCDLFPSSYFSK